MKSAQSQLLQRLGGCQEHCAHAPTGFSGGWPCSGHPSAGVTVLDVLGIASANGPSLGTLTEQLWEMELVGTPPGLGSAGWGDQEVGVRAGVNSGEFCVSKVEWVSQWGFFSVKVSALESRCTEKEGFLSPLSQQSTNLHLHPILPFSCSIPLFLLCEVDAWPPFKHETGQALDALEKH